MTWFTSNLNNFATQNDWWQFPFFAPSPQASNLVTLMVSNVLHWKLNAIKLHKIQLRSPFSSFFRISSFFPPFWAKCPPCPPFSCLLGLCSIKCTLCSNFRALILYFSKKFPASLRLAWILFLHILLVSAHYFIYFILCACFFIILTQAITFLVCKDWSKVFLHTSLHKKCLKIIFHTKLFWNCNKKCLGHFEVNNTTAS